MTTIHKRELQQYARQLTTIHTRHLKIQHVQMDRLWFSINQVGDGKRGNRAKKETGPFYIKNFKESCRIAPKITEFQGVPSWNRN